MVISKNTRQAYSEVDEFLEQLDDIHKNQIPEKLRKVFKNEKDNTYIKHINSEIPISEQNLKEETLGIIALLNLQYWCKDEEEKKKLLERYSENERIYQEKLKEKYNPDNLFNRKQEKITNYQNDKTQIIQYKEFLIVKIFKKIKSFFSE